MGEDRQWMYEGWRKNAPSLERVTKTEDFVNRAFALPNTGDYVRCPCSNCRNCQGQIKRVLSQHLCKYGFMPNYEVWVHHGETLPPANISEVPVNEYADYDRMDEMLDDLREDIEFPRESEDPPTPEVKKFFDLLKASEEPLHEYTSVTILAFVTRLVAIKSKFVLSRNCYKELLKLFSDVLPPNHKMPKDVYQSKNYSLVWVWTTKKLMFIQIIVCFSRRSIRMRKSA